VSKIILGLVGPIASGKGTVKKYIEEKYNSKDCRFSTALRDVLNRISVPVNRENMQQVSTVLRQTFGEDLLAKIIVEDAKNLESDIIIIDGVRRKVDIKYLEEMDNFFLVAINAEAKIRYERMIARNENLGDQDKSYEQFLADHEAEADKEVPVVMKEADFTIDNSGDIALLHSQIEEIISKILKK